MVTLVEGGNLAGSVTALDLELRNLVRPLGCPHRRRRPCRCRQPSGTAGPGPTEGGWHQGLRADLVELDAEDLQRCAA